MWHSIAGAVATIRRSCTKAAARQKRTRAGFRKFFTCLTCQSSSPLKPSLAKLKLDHKCWTCILDNMDSIGQQALEPHAKQAESYAKLLGRLAAQAPRDAFHQKVTDSLESGDSWVHKWTRNATVADTIGKDTSLGYTTHRGPTTHPRAAHGVLGNTLEHPE